MATASEKKNQRIAAATTVVVNAIILLIAIFLGSWKMAGQGQGDYPGIEVNLGYDEQGSGDIEPETPIGDEKAQDDENAPAEAQEQRDETVTEAETEPAPAETKEAEPSETLTDPNSDVEIKEKKTEEKPAEKTPEKKPVEKVVEKPVEKKPDPPKVDQNAVFKSKTTTNPTQSGDGEGKKGTEGNQGDDVNKEGNKGVPGGTPGAAVYKGTPGGGDGGIFMTGFKGFGKPEIKLPELPENSYGKYKFKVKVDEDGYVISVTSLEIGLSHQAEREMKAIIEKTRWPPQGENLPPSSEGTVEISVVSGKKQ